MKEVNAYLSFDGKCRRAMEFYQHCLGGDLEMSAYPDDSGAPSTAPDAPLMHSQLLRDGAAILMASDSDSLTAGNSVSVAIQCESVEEIDRLFAALSKDGTVFMPVSDAPWGARFGMLKDQFGIQWLLNHTLTSRD